MSNQSNTDHKINLGSGYKRYPNYINVDSNPNCKPDHTVNLDDKNLQLPFPDNSVTHIIAHHVLEHIGDGFLKLLQEIYRICKHGAMIDIRVPHYAHETYINDFTHKRPITVEGCRLLSQKVNQHEIKTNGTSSTLGIMLGVDFEIVSYDYVYDSFYDNIMKTAQPQELQRLFREALNTTLEIHIVLVAVKE